MLTKTVVFCLAIIMMMSAYNAHTYGYSPLIVEIHSNSRNEKANNSNDHLRRLQKTRTTSSTIRYKNIKSCHLLITLFVLCRNFEQVNGLGVAAVRRRSSSSSSSKFLRSLSAPPSNNISKRVLKPNPDPQLPPRLPLPPNELHVVKPSQIPSISTEIGSSSQSSSLSPQPIPQASAEWKSGVNKNLQNNISKLSMDGSHSIVPVPTTRRQQSFPLVANPGVSRSSVLAPVITSGILSTTTTTQRQQTARTKTEKHSSSLSRVDISVAMAYFCNAFVITLPVILTPMIAQGYALHSNHELTAFCGRVASVAMMGGGFGKIINGIICQQLGGITTASTYLVALGCCALALSLSTSLQSVKWIIAGMEFFSSAMWVACSVILSNYHNNSNANIDTVGDSTNTNTSAMRFAKSISFLSLSSTVATLAAKIVGSIMLKILNWRQVAQCGALLTLLGSFIIKTITTKEVSAKRRQTPSQQQYHNGRRQQHRSKVNSAALSSSPSTTSLTTMIKRAKSVVKNKLFWTVGIAHVSGFLARTSDRMMAPFLRDVTGLSYPVCGGFTASITLGFALGVKKAQSFFRLDSLQHKNRQLSCWYAQAMMALIGLILVGSELLRSVLHPNLLTALVVTCSILLASSVAFPFYQIPNIVSTVAFEQDKAICLSFLEGLAFFLSAPIWAMSSHLVKSYGWSVSWSFVTMIFGVGAVLMMNSLQPVLKQDAKET